MPEFRKKPVVIEAMRIPIEEIEGEDAYMVGHGSIVGWFMGHGFRDFMMSEGGKGYEITTLEGVMRADAGDWIIRGVKGEFYPCKPDIFEATYEPPDDVALMTAIQRATFPEMWIVNGGQPQRIAKYIPVNCPCGPMARPELDHIGDESISRLVRCRRCGAELGKLVLPVDPEELTR